MINRETNTIFFSAFFYALVTLQPFMFLLVVFMWFFWEDSQYPAFDSKDYEKKMMNAPLKPWQKGN